MMCLGAVFKFYMRNIDKRPYNTQGTQQWTLCQAEGYTRPRKVYSAEAAQVGSTFASQLLMTSQPACDAHVPAEDVRSARAARLV